ncbi:hypothetical protein TNCV_3817631 [Trichonephila clavipes]|nr:hypothetical protein TNCV_3817631 [Trichonephila clavipes]
MIKVSAVNIEADLSNPRNSLEQKECAAFHSRRESTSGESPTSFPEDTSMPYSEFEPEHIRLQAEGHIHHAGWVTLVFIIECI